MDYVQVIKGWDDRAESCLLVALIQFAEHEIGKSAPQETDTLLQIESCITKFAKLIALEKLVLEIDFLKHYLLRVSHFSVGLSEALRSHKSGGLAFALAEISNYLIKIRCHGDNIVPPDFTIEDVQIMLQAARFVISRACPDLINSDKPADMKWIKNNFWDDLRDLFILHDTLIKLTEIEFG